MMRSFLRFGALSGGGWLLDCAILLVLSQSLGVPVSVANFVSSSTAALLVFSMSRFLIFESSRAQPFVKTLLYFFYTCGVIVAASAVIGPVVWLVGQANDYLALQMGPGQAAFLAKVIITPPQLLANFFMSRYLSQAKYQKWG